MEKVWQQRVEKAVTGTIQSTIFAGFNTNVDAVVHCNGDNVANLLADPDISLDAVNRLAQEQIETVTNKNEFVAVLKDALGKGKSCYVILENLELLDWLEQIFTNRRESMGGQAGIIANQMAALEAKALVYTALLSKNKHPCFSQKYIFLFLTRN